MIFSFNGLNEFLRMGGYALYVWLAYGIFVVLLLTQALQARVAKVLRKINSPS